jgi:predicted HNH restriction endonuclease
MGNAHLTGLVFRSTEMALVTTLEPSSKDRQSVHRPTRCLYSIVEVSPGERFLQLDTFGSDDREIPEKVSQSIQFDRQAAGQLLQLLKQTFPNLGGVELAHQEKRNDSDEEEEVEGRTLLRLHMFRERNPRLVKRKKKSVLETTGSLECEVCGFDFRMVYGKLGEGFAECHHRTPLSELAGAILTRLVDLAIVCSNCHRMLHRQRAQTVEQLREIVMSQRMS